MNTVKKTSLALVAGAATFLAGGEAGRRMTKMDDVELTKVLRDHSRDGQRLGFGEAVQFLDSNKNGRISETERKKGEELRNQFETVGRAMLETADNINKALQLVEPE